MFTNDQHLSRRTFLSWLFTAGVGIAAGCADQSAPATSTSAANSAATLSPTIDSSASLVPTLANRIRTIVFFIQENHTFDSLFAGFPGADSLSAGQTCPDMMPSDPPHQHLDALTPGGATTAAARCSYAAEAASLYWYLAKEFTLCDRYFSEVRGPSIPNYLMLTSAQTPIVNKPKPGDRCPEFCLNVPTLVDRLDERGLSWRDYGGILTDIQRLAQRPEVMYGKDAPYFADASAGSLPNIAWLNSGFLEDSNNRSGHPTGSLCAAQQYAAKVVNAAMASPQWNSMALFLIMDDWGGFYDHVVPPVVENWTDGTPMRYGYRVPCLVISPFARAGYISHELHSHVSLPRFAETVYGLAPLTARDAQASNMLDCFDFNQAPRAPVTLPVISCAG